MVDGCEEEQSVVAVVLLYPAVGLLSGFYLNE